MKVISAYVYKHKGSSCGNGSYTDHAQEVYLAHPRGYLDIEDDNPALYELVEGNLPGTIKCVPVVKPSGKVGPMMSGCFVYASDNRFNELCAEVLGHGNYAAVPVHDRFETQEEYDALSR